MDGQLLATLLGGLIAAGSSWLSLWYVSKRDAARWQEQNRRDTQARVYEHRRQAISEFVTVFQSLWSTTDDMRMNLSAPDPSDFEDALVPLWERKLTVNLYAGEAVRTAADAAYRALSDYVYRSGTNGNDVQRALDTLLSAARRELTEG